MELSLSKRSLATYVCNQLNNIFPDHDKVDAGGIADHISVALQRLEYAFSHVNSKYYYDGVKVRFNHLNSDQYAMFLYLLSNTVFKEKGILSLCSKLFLLNKTLHGIDAFYEVCLPDIFLFIHPLGTVLGRGTYSNYFIVYQRCGIGSNKDLYPVIGEYVTLHPGSSVLGNSSIGSNCKIASESHVLDMNVDSNSLYIGRPKSFTLKSNTEISQFWRK